MRAGLTLAELLVAMTCTAIIAAIAVPPLSGLADAAAVRQETTRLVAALDAARGTAVRLDAVATLTLSATKYQVTIDTVIALDQPGPAARSVVLGGSGAPLLFGPAGLAIGASNRTLTLSRGGVLRRVVVSRLGRITY